jgi:hypothetical protein
MVQQVRYLMGDELYSIRRQDLFAVIDLETWVQRTVQLTWRQR